MQMEVIRATEVRESLLLGPDSLRIIGCRPAVDCFVHLRVLSEAGEQREEDTLGVFRLGRVKSLETLGTR